MQVMLQHYTESFAPDYWKPLGLIVNGDLAVHLFFLISGFVLTQSFTKVPRSPFGTMARRFLRLGIPMAVAVLFAVSMWALLPDQATAAASVARSEWLATSARFAGSALAAAADASGASMLAGENWTTLFGGVASYLPDIRTSPDPPVWSLHIELWGSVLVLLLVRARSSGTAVYLLTLVLCAVLAGCNPLILFVLGHLACHATEVRAFHRARTGVVASVIGIGLIAAGATLAGEDINQTQRFTDVAGAANIVTSYTWFRFDVMLGAVMIFVGILLSRPSQRLLSLAFPLWLGKISFSLYLLHWPVMTTIGSLVFVVASPMGNGPAAAVALGAGLAVTLPLAVVFERFVDRPAIAVARIAGRKMPLATRMT